MRKLWIPGLSWIETAKCTIMTMLLQLCDRDGVYCNTCQQDWVVENDHCRLVENTLQFCPALTAACNLRPVLLPLQSPNRCQRQIMFYMAGLLWTKTGCGLMVSGVWSQSPHSTNLHQHGYLMPAKLVIAPMTRLPLMWTLGMWLQC